MVRIVRHHARTAEQDTCPQTSPYRGSPSGHACPVDVRASGRATPNSVSSAWSGSRSAWARPDGVHPQCTVPGAPDIGVDRHPHGTTCRNSRDWPTAVMKSLVRAVVASARRHERMSTARARPATREQHCGSRLGAAGRAQPHPTAPNHGQLHPRSLLKACFRRSEQMAMYVDTVGVLRDVPNYIPRRETADNSTQPHLRQPRTRVTTYAARGTKCGHPAADRPRGRTTVTTSRGARDGTPCSTT